MTGPGKDKRLYRKAAGPRRSLIRGEEPLPTSPRVCLKCNEVFPSLGPGNRICEKCEVKNRTECGKRAGEGSNGTRSLDFNK